MLASRIEALCVISQYGAQAVSSAAEIACWALAHHPKPQALPALARATNFEAQATLNPKTLDYKPVIRNSQLRVALSRLDFRTPKLRDKLA